jgi:hypothetical protein
VDKQEQLNKQQETYTGITSIRSKLLGAHLVHGHGEDWPPPHCSELHHDFMIDRPNSVEFFVYNLGRQKSELILDVQISTRYISQLVLPGRRSKGLFKRAIFGALQVAKDHINIETQFRANGCGQMWVTSGYESMIPFNYATERNPTIFSPNCGPHPPLCPALPRPSPKDDDHLCILYVDRHKLYNTPHEVCGISVVVYIGLFFRAAILPTQRNTCMHS